MTLTMRRRISQTTLAIAVGTNSLAAVLNMAGGEYLVAGISCAVLALLLLVASIDARVETYLTTKIDEARAADALAQKALAEFDRQVQARQIRFTVEASSQPYSSRN